MQISKFSLAKPLVGGLLFVFSAFSSAAVIIPKPPEIAANGYVLMDFSTGQYIGEKNAESRLAPASLTKIMTAYVIGKELNNGNITLDELVTVSEKAWAKNHPEGSKMFIEVGKQVSVTDLLKGIIVQSGNDACVAMAEHIAGSEESFADMMNSYAEKLGMTGSHFVNSHGIDHPEHYTTPKDMAILSSAIIREAPQVYEFYSLKEFTYNNIRQHNRNTLLWDRSLNVDGIKTGHTSEAGYSLITSAAQGDMRLISVVMGTESKRARKEANRNLLKYGFRFYETVTPYKAGESFVSNKVFMGEQDTVDLGITEDTLLTIPRGQAKNLKADIVLEQELKAPIDKGTVVGKLNLTLDGEDVATYPLVTLHSVEEGGLVKKAMDYIKLKLGLED